MTNMSNIVLFSLSGFSATANHKILLSSLTLLCYCLIVVLNVSLVLTIILDQSLHEPMYVFVCSLCINGIYGSTGFYPKFFFDLLSKIQVISYSGCLLQVFVIYSNIKIDYSSLVVMAYDRYVAICRPLEYHSVMSVRRTAVLVAFSWLAPLCCESMVTILTSTLKFCDSKIDKLYCENWSLVKLACGSTRTNNIFGLFVITLYCLHLLFILCSYVQLVKSALKSTKGKRKFTQTCVPHLLCLLNVSVALLFDVMYSRYGSASMPQSIKNFFAMQFIVIPPIINPIIYGLILTKIRNKIVYLCVMAGQRLQLRVKV